MSDDWPCHHTPAALAAIANSVDRDKHSEEHASTPYSLDDLREIIESLRKASSTDSRVENAIKMENGDLAILIQTLQSVAFEYLLYCELQTRPELKNYREILKHMVAADLEALPNSIRDRVIPPSHFTSLKSAFNQVRQNASAILNSSPKRGALKKPARYDFVNELADIYEQFTGRKACKVGKESGAKSGRKLLGRFYNFVLAALKPIDPDACAGIRDVIDAVIEARGKGQDLGLPLKFSG